MRQIISGKILWQTPRLHPRNRYAGSWASLVRLLFHALERRSSAAERVGRYAVARPDLDQQHKRHSRPIWCRYQHYSPVAPARCKMAWVPWFGSHKGTTRFWMASEAGFYTRITRGELL